MFTGIIETVGKVVGMESTGSNLNIKIQSSISSELNIDQSVSHNGACLTVIKTEGNTHVVTAIDETLQKTNLGSMKIGDPVNLERSMILNTRIDGHLVQGHIDTVAHCVKKENRNGSYLYMFKYKTGNGFITAEKGSVCVNGVSLTVVDSGKDFFSVAIIPYTFENTNFKILGEGNAVNVEFDIIAKYVARILRQEA